MRRQLQGNLLWIGGLLVICWAVEFLGRAAHSLGLLATTTRDALGLISVTALSVASVYVLARTRSPRAVRGLLAAGVLMLALFQISDVLDEFSGLAQLALFAKGHPLHQIVEHGLIVTSTILFVLAFYLALLDSDRSVRSHEQQYKLLQENIREREAAEQALREARAALEAEVQKRTSELAERNRQLQIELTERERFEGALARRLRYEEGLAACSAVLLSDADARGALSHALAHLQAATQCSRVYLFENGYCTESGPYAELTHEVWDPVAETECQPTPGLRLHYNQGLHRWRELLAHGEPVSGTLGNVPVSERPLLERFRAKSFLLLPVGWEGRWRGFLGFDEIQHERPWTATEIRMLRTAAEMFGACKERLRAEEALRKAYDELERRVDDRTSDLSRANEQLSREVADRRRAEQEKRKLEHQLRQAQKMQAIGTLAGGIAHDFNNILASIIGYTELGIKKLDATEAEAQAGGLPKYFNEVLKAANRARELVRQILIFSRQNEAERVPVFPHIVAQEVAALLRASCPANIIIEMSLDPESGAVLSDPIQMHQVLLNLSTNAQHAMKRTGGTLSIAVDPIELDISVTTSHGQLRPGPYVLITVSDTGHGMDPATLERIFEPFFTTKSVSEGTGMGLAIVHGIVTGQGGAITVQSVLERGTSFQVYLPRHDGPLPQVTDTRSEGLRGSEHVLVVDDEPQLVALWSELLQGYGYQVTGFTSSLAALSSFRDEPERYDIVLLDQIMPGMTGAELAQNILRTRPGMPIIMATGFSEEITPEVARGIGIAEFVYKPILGNDLATAIRKAIDRAIAATN